MIVDGSESERVRDGVVSVLVLVSVEVVKRESVGDVLGAGNSGGGGSFW
jgi:hypothetical protein